MQCAFRTKFYTMFSVEVKTMGRVAVEENDEKYYRFFFHLSNYMVGMEKIAEADRAQEARNIIIQKISSDENIFTRVSCFVRCITILENTVEWKTHSVKMACFICVLNLLS